MSKTKDAAIEQQNEQQTAQAALEELTANGQVTLTAASREDIYRQGDQLVASLPEGTDWTRSIVDYNAGQFAQTYYIIKK